MKLHQPAADNSNPVHAVTFDCWGTLIYERDTDKGYAVRVDAVQRVAREAGAAVDNLRARKALDVAWSRHWQMWCDGVASGVGEIANWSLRDLGIEDFELAALLADELASVALDSEVIALPGASITLERLTKAKVGLALICDTGFSPGSVVRQLLDRVGLLDMLSVQVFSDEAGVPKPHADVFHLALAELDVQPQYAVHVGDLRHTDIKGARAIGMGTIRINDHHDDQTALPDADAVAQSHAGLRAILGID
ncbi:MAG: putative hydrolase of the HAD superfamily [Myxococcota bacterium]|jgi:putative hydrolase of the HAD superfamily